MATAEKTLAHMGQAGSWPIHVPTEPADTGRCFGRRGSLIRDAWNTQRKWVRLMLAPPLSADKDADVAAVTRINQDEVTLARLSRTPGRVVISLSDQQASRIKQVVEGD